MHSTSMSRYLRNAMELILWRHCDAQAGVPDAARPLTPRGRDEASKMAAWLSRRLAANARILVSPAIRAQQTAAALGRPFETIAALAPGASVDNVLNAAGWPDAKGTTVIVGHEPTLGDVAAHLITTGPGAEPLRKGAIAWLVRDPDTKARALLKIAATPASIGD